MHVNGSDIKGNATFGVACSHDVPVLCLDSIWNTCMQSVGYVVANSLCCNQLITPGL